MHPGMCKLFLLNMHLMSIFLVIGNLSCGGDRIGISDVSLVEVSGLIIDFEARSLTDIDHLTIETAVGQIYELNVSRNLGEFTPSHIRQHMVHGELVEISYFRRDGEYWLKNIRDFTFR